MTVTVEGADRIAKKLTALADLADIIEDDAADAICEVMRATAVRKLTDQQAVDTGRLRDSVNSQGADFIERPDRTTVSVGISTTVPYALFIEYGTGPLGDPEIPHTDKMSWVYPTGRTTVTSGLKAVPEFAVAVSQPARPFMRPALYDNRKAFVKIIEGAIMEVWAE